MNPFRRKKELAEIEQSMSRTGKVHHINSELKASLDGELSVWRQILVRLHLLHCAACREERNWLGQLGSDMKRLERAEPRPELRSKILASLPDAPPSGQPIRGGFAPRPALPRYATGLVSLAIFGVLLSGGVFAYRRFTVPVPSNMPSQVALRPSAPPTVTHSATSQQVASVVPFTVEPTPERDPLSERASQLVAEEEHQERIAQAKKKRADRLKPKGAKKETVGVETPILELASAEHGATGAGLLVQFRETVTKFSGKLTALPTKPNLKNGNRPQRDVMVRVPAEKAEAFLASLNQVGTLTQAPTAQEALATSETDSHLPKYPHRLSPTTANSEQEFTATPRSTVSAAPHVLTVQPDRSGYVSLRIRLLP